MAYNPTIGLGSGASPVGGYGGYGGGMSNYSNPLLQQDRMLGSASPQQYDPNAYIDPRQIAVQSMMLQQMMGQAQFNRQDPKMALGQNAGSFLSQAVQQIGGFGSGAPSGTQTQAPAGDTGSAQERAIDAAVQSHRNALLIQDPTMNMGKALYNATAAVMIDPAYQDSASQQILSRYAQQAVGTFKYNPNEQKDSDMVQTAQDLAIQKAKTDLMKDKLGQQFVLVDSKADPKTGVPVNSRLSPTLSMYNPDGSTNPTFQSDVADAYARARSAGAEPTLVPADKFMADQSAAKDKQLQLEQQKAQTAALTAQANAAAAPGANPQNDKAITDGLYNMDIDPMSLNYRTRNYYVGQVKQQHPDYDETNYVGKKSAMQAYAPGGQVGQNLASAGTAVQHTQSLIQAVKDQDNSDPNVVNAARNKIQTEFGLSTAPQDVKSMMVPYATEVLKSISKNGGTEDERAALTAAINAPGSTTTNAISALNKLQGMFLDRVTTYKQAYNQQTGRSDFNQRYAGGLGSNMDTALRSHERSLYNGQTVVTSPQEYGMVPTGSPFTNKMPGDPNFGKIGIKN